MSISPRFLQDLRDRLTLSEIISRRVKLTRAGREFKGCCPFHREKSPSFYVNDEKQFFHCFGCGAHGDVLGFVMRHDNLSFPEAIELLAAQAGLDVPRQSFEDKQYSAKEKSLYSLCEDAAKWFESQLHDPKNREVLSYVVGRGLSDETINAFRLGYAPGEDQSLRKHLQEQGYTDTQMIEAGVIKASSTAGREPYSFFRDRVMFPVADARGRVVAFGGRILPEHMRPPQKGDFKPPKYINSADTPLFHKGRTLYAGQHARIAAKDHKLIVVEGYMDVIACHQAGFRGAVAPLGTALTEEQIALLWKMIPHDEKEPVLCFDGDEAGYRAALRAAERVLPLLKPQQSVRIAFLPEGEDPDTFLREKGAGGFSDLIGRATSLIDFLWAHQIAGKQFTTPEARAGLSARLEGLSSQVADSQLQYHYKQMFREKLRELFGGSWKFNKAGAGGKKGWGNKPSPVDLPIINKQKAESLIPQIMLLTVINHPQIYPFIADEFHRLEVDGQEIGSLYHTTLDILENIMDANEENLDSGTLLTQIRGRGMAETLDDFISQERLYIHAGFARPEGQGNIADDVIVEGWKSLWNQWNKTILQADLMAARLALVQSMTPENESRLLALKQVADDLGN